jgi:hypothetical protein
MQDIETMIDFLYNSGMVSDLKDKKVIRSLRHHTHVKEIGLTSRQVELVTTILKKHRSVFEEHNVDFNSAIVNTRLGVRTIDRVRSIKLIDGCIAVRFPFSTQILKKIRPLQSKIAKHFYKDKTHFFPATHKNLYQIISALEGINFEIDKELINAYEDCKDISLHKHMHLPYVEIGKIERLHKTAKSTLIDELGTPTSENIHLFKDRSILYGTLVNQDQVDTALQSKTELTGLIANRTKSNVNLLPSEFEYSDIFNSMLELNRFPLMIVLDDKSTLQQLKTTHNALQGIVANEDISVLYRLPNKGIGVEYNEYVKSSKINNRLDKTTKVLYTNKNKLQKTILKENIQAKTILLCSSTRLHSKLESYATSSDLIIHYDTDVSSWRSISNRTELLRRIDANVPIKNI